MAPRKRAQSQTHGAAQAPADSAKKRRVAAPAAASSSRKRKRVSDTSDGAETPQLDQLNTKRPRWGRVTGRLAGLMELPMDILFEIFGHLMPLDVLRLARTTKQFRNMLMHRSSVSIWIAARNNVPDLPDCPPYMSEPQFANLVFDTHCHQCLSPNTRSIDWRVARRICTKCAKDCMVENYPSGGEFVYKAVPCKYGKRGRPFYYHKDLSEFQAKRDSFTNPEELNRFVKERQALVSQMEKHGTQLEDWAASQARDRSEQLDDLRRERKEAIIRRLTELGWGPEIEQIPFRDDLSRHKLVKQATRLTPRIWSNIQCEMIAYMQLMKSQRLERERKALVISRKRIAVSILRAYKISQLPFTDVMPEPMDFCAISQVAEILELPTETQVTEETFAPVAEKMDKLIGEWRTRILELLVQKVKDSKPRVDRPNATADSSTSDNVASSSSADPKGKGKAKVVDPPDDSQIMQDLSLATTVFNCRRCNPRIGIVYGLYDTEFGSDADYASSEDDFDPFGFSLGYRQRSRSSPLFYPKVLGHHCLTKQGGYGFSWDSPGGDPTKQYDYPMGNRTRWSCNLLHIDEKAGMMAANVITACELNPKTTTAVEMDRLSHQLACLECLEWSDEVWDQADAPVFGWRAAVAHNCRSHPNKTNVEWMLIDDEQGAEVVDVEEEYRAGQAIISALVLPGFVSDDIHTHQAGETAWVCVHCLDLPSETECMELSNMRNHLNQTHSISEPQENRDYFKNYEAPQGRKAYTPQLRISLTMDRPDNVPAPGERRIFDHWGPFGFLDEFEDDYYDDDLF